MDLEDDYGVGGDDDDLKRRRWTKREDEKLRAGVKAVGSGDWAAVCNTYLGGHGRSPEQCRHRWEHVLSEGLVKGAFTEDEDEIIVRAMKEGRQLTWMQIAARIPGRIGKQCRERWTNHLDPSLKKGGWTPEEDSIMAEAQTRWGNAWTKIAELLPGRAENAVKNRWNSAFRRNNSAVFGKATGEKARSAVATARVAMELIDRGDGGARDAGGSGRRRPPAASAWDAAAPPPPRKRASTPPAAPPRSARSPAARPSPRSPERRRHFHFPPPDAGGAAPDGLDLVILAIESEQASAPPSPCRGRSPPRPLASPRIGDARRGYRPRLDAAEAGPPSPALSSPSRKRRRDRPFFADAEPAAAAEDEPEPAPTLRWPPPAGKLTAAQAMDRFPAIRNHNQLRQLERTKVRRPAMGRASGCDIFVYDERELRDFAEALARDEGNRCDEGPASPGRGGAWAPPPGKITAQLAMDAFPSIRHRDQLRHLKRCTVRRPTLGRAAACNVLVFDEAEVRELARTLSESADDDADHEDASTWAPPDGKLTTKMALDKYGLRHHDRLRHLPREVARRPTLGRAAACNVIVFDDADVRALAESLGGRVDDDDARGWAPPEGKCTATDAMRDHKAIRNHNQLKHLHRVKVRRPAAGKASGCDIYVYEKADVAALAAALEGGAEADMSSADSKEDPDACTSQGSSLAGDVDPGRDAPAPPPALERVDAAADAEDAADADAPPDSPVAVTTDVDAPPPETPPKPDAEDRFRAVAPSPEPVLAN